jgi:hypothetical protein
MPIIRMASVVTPSSPPVSGPTATMSRGAPPPLLAVTTTAEIVTVL